MNRLKSILGYTWAALTVPLIMATFMGMESWTHKLASATGVTVSPWFSGGAVVRTIDHGAYQTRLHRPVFDALIGERKEGFVQVDWAPAKGLPARIQEDVDYDGDGRNDFRIQLDTKTVTAQLTPHTPQVSAMEGCYRLKEAMAVRVLLHNQTSDTR